MTARDWARRIDHWVFDLDNTLYPATSDLFAQIDVRMTAYVQRYLQIETAQARALQKRYYEEFGATLAGMMARHGMEPHDFLQDVHDVDYSPVTPDAPLAALITALPGKKLVFTNGSRQHARRVLDRLDIAPCFDGVFAIEDGIFAPKPSALAFERLQARFGFAPNRAMFFDDLANNIAAGKAFGMRTALVRSGKSPQGHPAEADFVIDGLHAFLAEIGPAAGL
jgi:putative hydrolase of the HAD superfamily